MILPNGNIFGNNVHPHVIMMIILLNNNVFPVENYLNFVLYKNKWKLKIKIKIKIKNGKKDEKKGLSVLLSQWKKYSPSSSLIRPRGTRLTEDTSFNFYFLFLPSTIYHKRFKKKILHSCFNNLFFFYIIYL